MALSALLTVPALVSAGQADEGGGVRSLDQIAVELDNPASGLTYISGDMNYLTYRGGLPGADDQTELVGLIRSSIGFPLSNGKNITLRATVPIVLEQAKYVADREYYDYLIRQRADSVSRDGYFETGHGFMGDISYDLAYGGVSRNNWITMYGVAGLMGTAKDTSAARDQELVGPQFALGKVTDWGVIGAWATHLVDIGGDNPTGIDTRLTTLKVFFSYGLGNGWRVVSNPVITYDWEGAGGNKLLLPIGGGVSKMTRVGSMPLDFAVEIQNYIVSPDAYGPEWLLSFSLTPAFPTLFHH